MTQRTFTDADLERMAAATARSNPISEAGQRAYGPAARVLLTTLADGRPATIQELALAAGLAPGEADAILREVNGVERDADGRVTGMGMTLNPTPHQVETGGHRLYAWCAADALGMLPAIGRTVRITSACPETGEAVTITAGPEGVRDMQPPEAVVSAVLTGDPDDIRGSLCDLGNFFPPRAASGWAKEHPDGVLFTIPQAFRYALSLTRFFLGE
jgi:alkylmercury lyase